MQDFSKGLKSHYFVSNNLAAVFCLGILLTGDIFNEILGHWSVAGLRPRAVHKVPPIGCQSSLLGYRRGRMREHGTSNQPMRRRGQKFCTGRDKPTADQGYARDRARGAGPGGNSGE